MSNELPLLIADVYELAGRLRRSGDVLARELGQSQARWQVLSVISGGDWTIPHIGDRLGVTRQSVQRIADELAADNLATFAPNPHHRRSPFLHPTGRGRDVLQRLTEANRSRSGTLGAQVSARDLAATRRTVAALLTDLREEEDNHE
jgi:DNA-binding MarR family transcriptional regulator